MTARTGDVIHTVEQLEAMPVETMIRDHMGDPHVRYVPYRGAGRWQEVGMDDARTSTEMVSQIGGGFTVLHVPGERPRTADDVIEQVRADERERIARAIVDELARTTATARPEACEYADEGYCHTEAREQALENAARIARASGDD